MKTSTPFLSDGILVVISSLKKNAQIFGACCVVLGFCLVGFFLSDRKKQVRLTQWASRALLKIIGVRIEGPSDLKPKKSGRLIVANHLSVIDVLVLSSRYPAAFITSVETRETPFFGWIAMKGGCLFVERRSRHRIKKDLTELGQSLKEGIDVVLFAEGTSSCGESVLPFKKGLFKVLEGFPAPVLPVVLKYKSRGGQKITAENRDHIYYYGDHKLHDHLGKIFSNPEVIVQLETLPEHNFTAEHNLSQFVLQLENAMREAYASGAD